MNDAKAGIVTLAVVGGAAVGAVIASFFGSKSSHHGHSHEVKKPVVAQKPFTYTHPKAGEHAIEAWAAYHPNDSIKPFKYDPRPLGDDDVEIKITHCGICYSDIHQIDNGWGGSIFPIVPGHEIVGHVIAKGSKVTSLNINDRVGVGAQCLSCLESSCVSCGNQLEQYCSKVVFTYNSKYLDGAVSYGGYAKRVRVHSTFAFKIPENIKSAEAAPLFCAGATVYEPLRRFKMTKGHKVGVIGIGGLGHLGVQFAAALGCDVTAISHSPDKKELAHKLGAHHFISTAEEKKQAAGTFDFLLQTDNKTADISSYLDLLKAFGTLVLVGANEEQLQFVSNKVLNARSVTGSMIASPSRIKEMLELASEKRVVPMITVFDINDVNAAIDGVRKGAPRFRYVLKIQDA